MFNSKYRLTKAEQSELTELQRVVSHRKFELEQIKANSALVRGSKELIPQMEDVLQVLQNAQNARFNYVLASKGFTNNDKVSVHLATGKIIKEK